MTLVSRLRSSPFAFPVAVVVALLLLGISEASHWRSRTALDELSELSSSRLRVQRLLLSMTDAETAQRGYMLTGRSEYLEPYRNAIEGLPGTLKWLREHFNRRDEPGDAVVRLEEQVTEKLSELATTIRLNDEGRQEAARELLLSNIGKERMDNIRATAEQILVEEAKGSVAASQNVSDTLLANRIGVGTMTLLSLLGLYLYLRQTRELDEQREQQQLAVQAERDQLEAEVSRRTADLTDLSRHLMTAREDERGRLARDLHDELGALLTAAKLDAARIKMRVAAHSPEAAERLIHLNEMLNSGIALKRRIIEELRPSALANLGLVAALETLVRDFQARSDIKVQTVLRPVSLSPSSELTVYRLVQEALTNISKYARATTVQISLTAHDGVAEVEVSDDGVGFDPRAQRASAHGLLGMRYRVEAEGGQLHLQSTPGRGARISATLRLTGLAA